MFRIISSASLRVESLRLSILSSSRFMFSSSRSIRSSILTSFMSMTSMRFSTDFSSRSARPFDSSIAKTTMKLGMPTERGSCVFVLDRPRRGSTVSDQLCGQQAV